MDESQLINMFANGTYDADNLKGKTFEVEMLLGFKDLGFDGVWTKRFLQTKNKGHNKLGSVIFGQFRIVPGVWSGYQCVLLDYGAGFISVKDYIRQIADNIWLGVYEVGGHLKGWFRLREVEE
jgi:hypothetical protein